MNRDEIKEEIVDVLRRNEVDEWGAPIDYVRKLVTSIKIVYKSEMQKIPTKVDIYVYLRLGDGGAIREWWEMELWIDNCFRICHDGPKHKIVDFLNKKCGVATKTIEGRLKLWT